MIVPDWVIDGRKGGWHAYRSRTENRPEVMGAARSCGQAALDCATHRKQFGWPIAGFQLTQAKLANMAVGLHTGLLLALQPGRRKDGVDR